MAGEDEGDGNSAEQPAGPSEGEPTPDDAAEAGDAGAARAASRRSDAGLEAPDAGVSSGAVP